MINRLWDLNSKNFDKIMKLTITPDVKIRGSFEIVIAFLTDDGLPGVVANNLILDTKIAYICMGASNSHTDYDTIVENITHFPHGG